MVFKPEFKRLSDEDVHSYIYRMCSNKDAGLYDLTWKQVGEILNQELDEEYTESKYRKEYQAMQRGIDMKVDKQADLEEVSEDMEVKKGELYKQQVKTRDKLREMRKHLRDEARVENLLTNFTEAAHIIANERPIEVNTYPKNTGERVGVALLSDWHMGETVDNFMNTYNEEVFDERINKLTTDIIEYGKLMNVGTLKVLNIGDLISGGLHVSTRVSDEEDRIYQTMYVSEALVTMLLEFSKHFTKIDFYSVTDNHSRANKNKMEHIEKESFSRFIPWHLEARLANVQNVEIITNKINGVVEYDIGMIDIFHEKALFTHGHNGRLGTMVQDLAMMTRVFPIAVFTGHFHKNFEDEVHGVDLIMNPSVVGTGDYAKSIRRSSLPRQKLVIFENIDGVVKRLATFTANL